MTHEQLNAEWSEAAERDASDAGRCIKRVKPTPLPPSFAMDAAWTHPTFASRLEPGACCELDEGHEGPHRNGLLVWHDPPALYVGGERIW